MLKFPLHLFILFMVFLFSAVVMAVDALPPSALPVSEVDFAKHLFSGLGSAQMKGLALIGMIVQTIQLGLRVPFFEKYLGRFAIGKYRLVLVLGLSWIGGVIYLMSTGLEFVPSLLHSNSVAAWQVLFHQGYKQFSGNKDESPAV